MISEGPDAEVFVSEGFAVEGSGGSNESNKYLIFGTGTKLYVTEVRKQEPEVSLYSAAPDRKEPRLDRKEPLLCVASGMFPPVIRFTWKRKKEDGKEEVLPAGAEQLELSESGRFSSIRMVDPDPQHIYEYRCSVQHEGGAKESPSKTVLPRPPGPPPPTRSLGFSQQLVFLIYSLLIAKNLLYFCSLFLISVCGTSRAE
ncbi:immunoglobulin lambda-1 light chain-like [Xiphophorus maculatus]|uniref:immunoglobulin lambda-1 light chain-like n=1 Tax=Xiphophorus maculatus TaxID=8083 RepID=UPI000C6DB195|nr:immunoglobulin lambda-1 light chain-like [Xiphophorus maculatus]